MRNAKEIEKQTVLNVRERSLGKKWLGLVQNPSPFEPTYSNTTRSGPLVNQSHLESIRICRHDHHELWICKRDKKFRWGKQNPKNNQQKKAGKKIGKNVA